jgi:hypothetical protein
MRATQRSAWIYWLHPAHQRLSHYFYPIQLKIIKVYNSLFYLLFVVCCLLFVVCCLLFVVCYLLFAICCFSRFTVDGGGSLLMAVPSSNPRIPTHQPTVRAGFEPAPTTKESLPKESLPINHQPSTINQRIPTHQLTTNNQ